MADFSRLPGPNADLWDWQLRGLCRGKDSSLFFHPEGERGAARTSRETAAKEICMNCPVQIPCADHALKVREPYGVWGGMTEEERELHHARQKALLRAQAARAKAARAQQERMKEKVLRDKAVRDRVVQDSVLQGGVRQDGGVKAKPASMTAITATVADASAEKPEPGDKALPKETVVRTVRPAVMAEKPAKSPAKKSTRSAKPKTLVKA